ncbi:MAG TPA: DUF4230 domain-containing protein [Acidobacteriaceae bacterium]|nr:DUF4230 domain-containing protein [Acidobacteriaceae bacterium]
MRTSKNYIVEPRPRRACFPAFVLGLLLGILGFAFFIREARTGIWDQLAAVVTGRSLSIDTSLPTVVNKIQRLQRLETVNYSLDKIVEGDRQSSVLPDFLVGDKLLLVVHGDVIAGVDLGQLNPSDVQVEGRSIQVHLPSAQVFVTALDNAKTRVYSRSTGLLVPEDPNLESQVREQAQQQIQQAALADGILAIAKKNASATVTSMLQGLGFQQVTVN